MIKTLTLGGVEVKFKSSAATNILYKRAFREDITMKLTEYSQNAKNLKKLRASMAEIRASEEMSDEEKAEKLREITMNPAYVKALDFYNDTLPKLAYVMMLEGTFDAAKIFTELNEDKYLIWLMSLDQDDLTENLNEVLDIWRVGARGTSKAKN